MSGRRTPHGPVAAHHSAGGASRADRDQLAGQALGWHADLPFWSPLFCHYFSAACPSAEWIGGRSPGLWAFGLQTWRIRSGRIWRQQAFPIGTGERQSHYQWSLSDLLDQTSDGVHRLRVPELWVCPLIQRQQHRPPLESSHDRRQNDIGTLVYNCSSRKLREKRDKVGPI